jgi:chromosomal replication initiator protein
MSSPNLKSPTPALTGADFWQACLRLFEQELTPQQFNTWIRPLHVEGDAGGLRLVAPNRFVQQWIKERFMGRIESLATELFAAPVPLSLCLGEAPAKNNDTARAQSPAPVQANTAAAPLANETTSLNPTYTFNTFVTGKANELARAAAEQVAENPGRAYNPLFVYGGVGLGKTHLIQAIGNYIREHNPAAKIRYIHAEKYISEVVRAYQYKSFDDFKRFYRSLDLLLIDDIQFFNGKRGTQEEFFYLFNTLTEAHKQVIITCDTYPKEIPGIEDRLISRFAWGLTVSLDPPDTELRVAILLNKAVVEGVQLSEDVAFFIAKHSRSNVRELEGALKRVLAFASFHGLDITLPVAKDALRDLVAVQAKQVSIENIQKTVADYYKIKVSDMHSKKRSRVVARPRQVAMALAKELTMLSLPEIGSCFGGRDHTTVLHACRQIAKLRDSVPAINQDVNTLLQVLRS